MFSFLRARDLHSPFEGVFFHGASRILRGIREVGERESTKGGNEWVENIKGERRPTPTTEPTTQYLSFMREAHQKAQNIN